jgi:hypothetical protein
MKKKEKSLSDYLPKKQSGILVQAKIPQSLHHEVKELLKQKELTIQELIVAAFQKFMDENQKDLHALSANRLKE